MPTFPPLGVTSIVTDLPSRKTLMGTGFPDDAWTTVVKSLKVGQFLSPTDCMISPTFNLPWAGLFSKTCLTWSAVFNPRKCCGASLEDCKSVCGLTLMLYCSLLASSVILSGLPFAF